MNVKAQLKSYEDVEFSVNMTAPVEDWRALLRELEKMKGDALYYAWPVGGVVGCVRAASKRASSTRMLGRGRDLFFMVITLHNVDVGQRSPLCADVCS
jgi:hypothetical protein